MLDKAFYEEEVKRLCLAFEQQVCSNSPFNILFPILLGRRAVMSPYTNSTLLNQVTYRSVLSFLAVPLWYFLCIHEVEGTGD